MIDEILGFHEPVIAYGQEAPSRISRTLSWDSSTIRFSALHCIRRRASWQMCK